jgi:hypothetical protein
MSRQRHRVTALFAVVVGTSLVSGVARAHIERPSYWPLPGPDCSITPCAGGEVPTPRPLASALAPAAGTTTRVVCRPDSLTRLKDSIARALTDGYDIRPSDHRRFGSDEADELWAINVQLFGRCGYDEIQPAVTASGNNDRVIIMPGAYTEATSRARPTNDRDCGRYKITSEAGDVNGAVSYAYQYHCPNDQNLIAVIGRGLGPGEDPQPPRTDRHGIPNLGPCIRCNLQIEGSGVSGDDVVIDAGRVESGNGPPRGSVKDVGIRADRADGFVLRKVTVRHAREHNIYVIEVDGYQLDQFKVQWAGEYGVLTFVGDHGLIQNCDAAGHGDSGLYPGAGAKTNTGRDTNFYPTARYSQEIRACDSHHNVGGYSGSDGNAVWVHHNNFYDNALGFTTDVFTAPGHPGFPQQGDLVEHNNFYSNNFNPYGAGSAITPVVAVPVGTGLWIAGGNDNIVRNNRFWDNWRRAVMLFAVPDATICGPVIGSTIPVPGCEPTRFSTSHHNRFERNVMGVGPDGRAAPNGTDFWWDAFPTNTGNCWEANTAAPGKAVTTSPLILPGCEGASLGTGSTNEAELVACFLAVAADREGPALCPWFTTPPAPGSGAAGGTVPLRADLLPTLCRLYGDARNTVCPTAGAGP